MESPGTMSTGVEEAGPGQGVFKQPPGSFPGHPSSLQGTRRSWREEGWAGAVRAQGEAVARRYEERRARLAEN